MTEKFTESVRNKTIGPRIRRIENGIDKYFCRKREESQDSLTAAQGPMIGYLIEHPDTDVFQKDLEREFSITGATASNMLKGLEKKGMIRRIQMPEDGRLKKIIPTPEAVAREKRIRSEILEMETGMLEGFSEEEKRILMSYMDRVIANLDAMNRKGSK